MATLPAKLRAGDDDRLKLGARGVEGGGQTCRSRADDDNAFLLHLFRLVLVCLHLKKGIVKRGLFYSGKVEAFQRLLLSNHRHQRLQILRGNRPSNA